MEKDMEMSKKRREERKRRGSKTKFQKEVAARDRLGQESNRLELKLMKMDYTNNKFIVI
jgi:hypothetical protein